MNYRLSASAVGDIVALVHYGNDRFGVAHTKRYEAGLLATVALLAQTRWSVGPLNKPVQACNVMAMAAT